MLTHPTLDLLLNLGLHGMAKGFKDLDAQPEARSLEHAEWLVGQRQPSQAEPLLAEATEIFERLEARPWLERTTRLASAGQPEAVIAGH